MRTRGDADAGMTAAFLAGATVLLLLPFVTKAFHVDDPLFLWTARQVQRAPLDPYGYAVHWYTAWEPASWVIQNPPLAAYLLALAAAAGGFREVALHLAFLLSAAAAVLGTWTLARRLCPYPELAALAVAASPVFLVSSTGLMCDTTMLALWTWAVALWVRGLDEGRLRWLALAALLAAAAALTKYYALALVPLLLATALAHRPRPRTGLLLLALPVAVLVAYEAAMRARYGSGLVLNAAAYPAKVGALDPGDVPSKLLVGLAFTGGGLLFPLAHVLAGFLGRRALALLGAAFLALLFPAASVLERGAAAVPSGSRWLLAVQLAAMAAGGLAALAPCATELRRVVRAHAPRDAVLLSLWALGTYAFAALLNWTTNGRSVLPLAPAVAILLARALGRARGVADPSGSPAGAAPRGAGALASTGLLVPLVPVAAVAVLVGWADARLAGTARDAARLLADRHAAEGRTLWHQGHWGFQWYAERAGMRPLDLDRSPVRPGDRIVVPENNTNVEALPPRAVRLVDALALPAGAGVTTMHWERGAGFYSDRWGVLPFAFGPVPPERYRVYEVTAPWREAGDAVPLRTW